MPKLVCISDTHRQEKNIILPKGDILICAGDYDIRDEMGVINVFEWFQKLDYSHIIWIAGNHDLFMENLYKENIYPEMPENVHYLCNQSVEIEGIKFWGSPYSPRFGVGWAFNGYLDLLKQIWSTIPEDTDIVITHCNPFGINDVVTGISQGCPALRDRIKEIKPKFHISGHIHEGYGIYQDENTTYINAALHDDFYELVNKPVEIYYD